MIGTNYLTNDNDKFYSEMVQVIMHLEKIRMLLR